MSRARKTFRASGFKPASLIRPMSRFFDYGQHIKIGKHKGTWINNLPLDWVEWAFKNIEGFKDEYSSLYQPHKVAEFIEGKPKKKRTKSKRRGDVLLDVPKQEFSSTKEIVIQSPPTWLRPPIINRFRKHVSRATKTTY